MHEIGYNSSIAWACTRHRVSRITRLGRRRSIRNRRVRWGRDEMVMERFPRRVVIDSRGSEKNRLIRTVGEREVYRVSRSDTSNKRTESAREKRKKSERDEKERDQPTRISLLGNSQLPVSVLLVASRASRLPLTTWNQDRLPELLLLFLIIIMLYTPRHARVRLELNAIISRFLLLLYG